MTGGGGTTMIVPDVSSLGPPLEEPAVETPEVSQPVVCVPEADTPALEEVPLDAPLPEPVRA
jgi:hypothetical protein